MDKSACLGSELIAAFVDDRLDNENRRQVIEHLDRCEDCYELFVDVGRFQGEGVTDRNVLRPASSRWGLRQPLTWITAAAAVLVALLLVPVMTTDREGVSSHAASLVRAMDVRPEALLGSRWAAPSVFGFGPHRPDPAFGLGVQLVDLHVALEADDATAAGADIADLHRILAAANRADAFNAELEAAAGAAAEGRIEDVRTAAAAIEVEAQDRLDRESLAFGMWAEAGRLAAAGRDADFFGSATFTELSEQISEHDEPTVEELVALLGRGSLTQEDLYEAKQLFTTIISTHIPPNGDRR